MEYDDEESLALVAEERPMAYYTGPSRFLQAASTKGSSSVGFQ
jgi:hypothetical protein